MRTESAVQNPKPPNPQPPQGPIPAGDTTTGAATATIRPTFLSLPGIPLWDPGVGAEEHPFCRHCGV
jgi:hypothetical protein